eukprot:6210533-Ditylum_brightwellii.AAC.1
MEEIPWAEAQMLKNIHKVILAQKSPKVRLILIVIIGIHANYQFFVLFNARPNKIGEVFKKGLPRVRIAVTFFLSCHHCYFQHVADPA